jgi:hypothetical protein
MTRHHTPSDSTRRSSAGAPPVPEGLEAPQAAGGTRTRSLVQWILLIAILILPW